jgi:hypothetical protein
MVGILFIVSSLGLRDGSAAPFVRRHLASNAADPWRVLRAAYMHAKVDEMSAHGSSRHFAAAS